MSTRSADGPLGRFVGVVGRPQTYKSLLYLVAAFPLGVFYFVFIVTGFSLGLSLSVVLIGIPLLAGMVVATLLLFAFEQELAAALLPTEFERRPVPALELTPAHIRDELLPASIVGTGFLLTKFAFGIGALVLLTVSLVLSVVLLAAPIAVTGGIDVGIVSVGVSPTDATYTIGPWVVDTVPEAVVLAALGVPTLLASLHVVNLTATAYGRVMSAVVDAFEHADDA